MVKALRIIYAFLRLVRLPNLVMVILTMLLMRYCIVVPMLQKSGLHSQITLNQFIILILAVVLITAGGYVINDYFDSKTDLINRPKSVVLSRAISHKWGMILHNIFTGAGILLGGYLTFTLGIKSFVFLFLAGSGVLWFYSTTYKHQLLVGNIIVSLFTAIVPLVVLVFEFPLLGRRYGSVADAMGLNSSIMFQWFLYFSILAFLFSLIREIIKDAEDIEGDKAEGMRTLPIVGGEKIVKITVTLLSLITIGILTWFNIILKVNFISYLYLIFLVATPTTLVCYYTIKARAKNHYNRISVLLKLIMVMGIMYSFVARYLIIH